MYDSYSGDTGVPSSLPIYFSKVVTVALGPRIELTMYVSDVNRYRSYGCC